VLFHDAGFRPDLAGDSITLGPEQMAVIGFGRHATTASDLGTQSDIVIPRNISPLALDGVTAEPNATRASVRAPSGGRIRLVLRQYAANGEPWRSRGGEKPVRVSLDQVLRFDVRSGERTLPVEIQHNRRVWSGLSWAVGEVSATSWTPGETLTIRASSADPVPVTLKLEAYHVSDP
jgi:hypothetical protein